jgi:hypothetical protein
MVGWNPSSSGVAGYELCYGKFSGNYDYVVDVGNNTSCSISSLEEGTTYYFAVKAYDSVGLRSTLSEELAYTVPHGISSQNAGMSVNSATVYEDAEDSRIDGWTVYDNSPAGASIKNVYDNDRNSRVIQLSGSSTDNGYRLRKSDGKEWNNSEKFIVQWSMKFDSSFIVFIDLETTAGHRYIYYTAKDRDNLGGGRYVHFGLGRDVINGRWHTIVCDLQADLEDAQPGIKILEVNGFLLRGNGMVDDIKLHDN